MNTVFKKMVLMACLSLASGIAAADGTTQVGSANVDPFGQSSFSKEALKGEEAAQLKKQEHIRMYKNMIRVPVIKLLKKVDAIPSSQIRFASIMKEAPYTFERSLKGCVEYSGTIGADALVKMAIDAEEQLGEFWPGDFVN